MARLKDFYNKEIISLMMKEFGYKNVMQVPKLLKIVVNIGVGESKDNPKAMEVATKELTVITGQKTLITKAKKSISNFKLRENMPIGCKVTLRGKMMYEFCDRLINLAIPRIKDFRGLNNKGFDNWGNYNLGLREQYIFPEVNIEASDKARGMNITFITNAKNNEEARKLLQFMGMPFKKK